MTGTCILHHQVPPTPGSLPGGHRGGARGGWEAGREGKGDINLPPTCRAWSWAPQIAILPAGSCALRIPLAPSAEPAASGRAATALSRS